MSGGLQSMGSQRADMTEPLSFSTLILRTIFSIWLIKTFSTVEIEPNQWRSSKGYLFRDCNSKGGRQHLWGLADTRRQAEEWESFAVDREEGSRCVLIGDCRHGSHRQANHKHSLLLRWSGEHICFLQLAPSWKW